jgi:hypothetical protein
MIVSEVRPHTMHENCLDALRQLPENHFFTAIKYYNVKSVRA